MGNSSLGERQRVWQTFVVASLMIIAAFAHAGSLSETIKKIKPSIVGIGTYQATRQPPAQLSGTGFAIGEGRHVITNAHVLPEVIDSKGKGERLAVFVGRGEKVDAVPARTVALDPQYDLAVLELERRTLPSLALGNSSAVQEGRTIAFTGFPIGSVLGLHPVTHTGTVSAVTPIVTPVPNAGRLNPKLIRRMRRPYDVFQLDATAYPGNSGSPVFDPQSGEVLGVINKVFVQGTKEAVLEKPSGITYAIPIDYAKALLRKKGIATGAR